MATKTYAITLRVAHAPAIGDTRANYEVLKGLLEGIEALVFPIFVTGKDGEEYDIAVESIEAKLLEAQEACHGIA